MTETPEPPAEPDYTTRSIAALTEAARTERDFADWFTHVIARVAGEMGSSAALTAGRPGSWESANLDQLLRSAVGGDDEYLPLPDWRKQAPVFAHEAYGLRVGGTEDYSIVAAGHVDWRRFIAAAGHFVRHEWGAMSLGEELRPHQRQVSYLYAVHAHDSTPASPKLDLTATERTPGAFPVTVIGGY